MALQFLVKLVFVAALSSTYTATATTSSNVVDLGYAQYQGVFIDAQNVTSFSGIRYAAPPIGNYRFEAPKAPETVEGVQVADTVPPQCLQGNEGASATASLTKRQISVVPTISSEDCLFLTVTTPGQLQPRAKLPVVVWIHGGGYAEGNQSVYHGSDLINDAHGGVITVILQYRLGLFGFLAGTEVKKNGALNAGLLDQTFALQWVQKYIGLFGGDASQVTIWGQSAGAGSVLQHIVANGGNTQPPLFRAGISSSIFLPSQYNYNDSIPEGLYTALVQQSGCSSASNTFKCLQEADSATLEVVNNNITLNAFTGLFGFSPVVDGTFIVESPTKTIQKGRLNGEVFFAVTNTFEGEIFVSEPQVENETLSVYVQNLFPTLSSSQVTLVVDQYTGIGLDGTFNQAVAVMGESSFICPTYRLLAAFPNTSYKGEFAVPPGLHGLDIFFYFPSSQGLFGAGLVYNNTVFIASFAETFLAVVKTLNPNDTPDPTNITPFWPKYIQGNTEMLFNRTEDGQPLIRTTTTDRGLLQRCSVWESLAAAIGQ